MSKISVIIPVYNTEKYLGKCLESVCNQTLSDIEIICVNDCSPDGSLEILKKYACKDDRVKIIDFNENKGAAAARNAGMEVANGEYIGFVDSDDWVDLDFYEKLYNAAVKFDADVAKGEYKYAHDGFVNYQLNEKIRESKTNFSYEYCSAIFKSCMIRENKIQFPLQKDMEDPVFAFCCANCANSVVIVNSCYVNIFKRDDSATAGVPNRAMILDKISGLQKLIELSEKYNTLDASSGYVLALWLKVILDSTYDCVFEDKLMVAKKLLEIYQTYKHPEIIFYYLNKMSHILAQALKSGDLNKILTFKHDEKIYKDWDSLNEAKLTITTLEKSNRKLGLQLQKLRSDDCKNEAVYFISVVNNHDLYNRCIKNNPFIIESKNSKLVAYDNSIENISITKRYNDFLNNYDYSKEAWFVFCHCDWELMEDLTPYLLNLDKSCLYGPVGAMVETINNKCYKILTGGCFEKRRDGSDMRYLSSFCDSMEQTDTFDCQAMIVHSSLINKYNLRFDENLKWDLYVEDFCINSKLKYGVNAYVLPFSCCHWSGYHNLPASYMETLDYVNSKYPDNLFGGTVSLIGGRKYTLASEKEKRIYIVRRKHKKGQIR